MITFYFLLLSSEVTYICYCIYMIQIVYNDVLLCISSQVHIQSLWELEICHGGNIYVKEVDNCYKLGLDLLV